MEQGTVTYPATKSCYLIKGNSFWFSQDHLYDVGSIPNVMLPEIYQHGEQLQNK
jgi:hypothetical protein